MSIKTNKLGEEAEVESGESCKMCHSGEPRGYRIVAADTDIFEWMLSGLYQSIIKPVEGRLLGGADIDLSDLSISESASSESSDSESSSEDEKDESAVAQGEAGPSWASANLTKEAEGALDKEMTMEIVPDDIDLEDDKFDKQIVDIIERETEDVDDFYLDSLFCDVIADFYLNVENALAEVKLASEYREQVVVLNAAIKADPSAVLPSDIMLGKLSYDQAKAKQSMEAYKREVETKNALLEKLDGPERNRVQNRVLEVKNKMDTADTVIATAKVLKDKVARCRSKMDDAEGVEMFKARLIKFGLDESRYTAMKDKMVAIEHRDIDAAIKAVYAKGSFMKRFDKEEMFEDIDKKALVQWQYVNPNCPVDKLLEASFKYNLLSVASKDEVLKDFKIDFMSNNKLKLSKCTIGDKLVPVSINAIGNLGSYEHNGNRSDILKPASAEKLIPNQLGVKCTLTKLKEMAKEYVESEKIKGVKSKDKSNLNKAKDTKDKGKSKMSRYERYTQKRLSQLKKLAGPIVASKSDSLISKSSNVEKSETLNVIKDKVKVDKEVAKDAKASTARAQKIKDMLKHGKEKAEQELATSAGDKPDPEAFKKTRDKLVSMFMDSKKSDLIKQQNAKVAKSREQGRTRSLRNKIGFSTTGEGKVIPTPNPVGKAINKIGDHSVSTTGVVEVQPDAAHANVAQNIFSGCLKRVYDARDRIKFDFDNYSWSLNTKIFTPADSMNVRAHEYQHAFDRFVVAGADPEITHIEYGECVKICNMDVQRASEMLKSDSSVMTKPTADALMAELGMSKSVAETVASTFNMNTMKYCNSSVYMQLALLASYLNDLELAGIHYRYSEFNNDGVMHLNINPNNQDANVTKLAFEKINNEGRFVFRKKNISDTHLTILDILATGLDCINTVGTDLNHVFSSFDMDKPRFAILHEGQPVNHVINRAITSQDVWNFMFTMAENLGHKNDLVIGVTNALRVMNGNITRTSVRGTYIGATLEAKYIRVKRPHAHNPLWRLLGKEQPEVMDPLLKEEYDTLKSLEVVQFQNCATLASACLSVGISTLLDQNTIGGEQLNDKISYELNSASCHSFVDRMVNIQSDAGGQTPIFLLGNSVMYQTTGLTINKAIFYQVNWSNGLAFRGRPLTERDLWNGKWGRKIPYLIKPVVILPYTIGIPAEWGFSRPKVSMDAMGECISIGGATDQALWFKAGDKSYDQSLITMTPFKAINYARHMLTALHQHSPYGLDEDNRLYLHYEVRHAVGGRPNTVRITDDFPQPEFDEHLHFIEAGSLINYDWREGRQMVPVIYAEHFPNLLFQIIANSKVVDSLYAGLQCEGAPLHQPPVESINFGQTFATMGTINPAGAEKRGGRVKSKKEN